MNKDDALIAITLHEKEIHPGYEYTTTTGPRKGWINEDDLPEGEGWKPNPHRGRDGWDRFDYHEERYWMREVK